MLMNETPMVLLADDDIDDRYIFELALKDTNINCDLMQTEDGEKLINLVNSSSSLPDLIVLDINMPKVNGIECLKYLKNTEKYHSINVIMLSTSVNDIEVKESYRHGASLYVKKPTSCSELADILSVCISDEFRKRGRVSFENFLVVHSGQLKKMNYC